MLSSYDSSTAVCGRWTLAPGCIRRRKAPDELRRPPQPRARGHCLLQFQRGRRAATTVDDESLTAALGEHGAWRSPSPLSSWQSCTQNGQQAFMHKPAAVLPFSNRPSRTNVMFDVRCQDMQRCSVHSLPLELSDWPTQLASNRAIWICSCSSVLPYHPLAPR